MSEQTSMFEDDTPAAPPPFIVDYLTGFAATYAFGAKVSKADHQAARLLAWDFAAKISGLRAERTAR